MFKFIIKLQIHFKRQQYIWFAFYSLLLSLSLVFIANYKTEKDYYYYRAGDFARRDIKANQRIEIEDTELTESARNEAESRTPPIYDYDSNIYKNLSSKIESAFKLTRAKLNRLSYLDLKKTFEEQLSRVVADNIFKVFYINRFSWRFKQAVLKAVKLVPKRYIITDRQALTSHGKTKDLIINDIQQDLEKKGRLLNSYFVNRSSLTISDIYEMLISEMQTVLKKFSKNEQKVLKSFIKTLIVPNLTYNSDKTNANRKKARDNVKKAIVRINKGEIIVRDGDSVERQHLLIFSALKSANKSQKNIIYYIGQFLIFFLSFFAISFYVVKYSTLNMGKKDLWFISIIMVLYAIMMHLWSFISPLLREEFTSIPENTWIYLFPFLFPVLLSKVMLNVSSVSFIAILSALLVTVLGENTVLPLYIIVSAFTLDIWIKNITSRISLLKISIPVFLFHGAIAYSFGILSINNLDFSWSEPMYMGIFGFISALISVLFTEIFIPIFESLFRYTSNLKLLEFANFNHPLLRKLIISAPGTYQHSVAVGQLASEAAQVIGANSLLTRVGAYFHDVGKLKNPHFFIENQQKGDNPHDKKSPEESKDILQSHITYGVELAKKYRLGRQIIGIIEQHQGTSVMKFFYTKALDIGMDVKPADFRYIGPKPQTKEAALVMIADSIEAASRLLEDFSRPKVFKMIDNIVKDMFQDGQFDETDISPKKLHKIVQTYTKVVIAMNHNRIKYDK